MKNPSFHDDPEARITALLLEELSEAEAKEVRAMLADNAELAALHDRLKQTIDFVRSVMGVKAGQNEVGAGEGDGESAGVKAGAGSESDDRPRRLSEEKRQALLEKFKVVPMKTTSAEVASRPSKHPRVRWSRVVFQAAAILVLLGVLAAVSLPNFVRARESAASNHVVNTLRQLDGAKQQWALENHKSPSDTPTINDLAPYLGRGGGLPQSVAGETWRLGRVDESVRAEFRGKEAKRFFRGNSVVKGFDSASGEAISLSVDGEVQRGGEIPAETNAFFVAESAEWEAPSQSRGFGGVGVGLGSGGSLGAVPNEGAEVGDKQQWGYGGGGGGFGGFGGRGLSQQQGVRSSDSGRRLSRGATIALPESVQPQTDTLALDVKGAVPRPQLRAEMAGIQVESEAVAEIRKDNIGSENRAYGLQPAGVEGDFDKDGNLDMFVSSGLVTDGRVSGEERLVEFAEKAEGNTIVLRQEAVVPVLGDTPVIGEAFLAKNLAQARGRGAEASVSEMAPPSRPAKPPSTPAPASDSQFALLPPPPAAVPREPVEQLGEVELEERYRESSGQLPGLQDESRALGTVTATDDFAALAPATGGGAVIGVSSWGDYENDGLAVNAPEGLERRQSRSRRSTRREKEPELAVGQSLAAIALDAPAAGYSPFQPELSQTTTHDVLSLRSALAEQESEVRFGVSAVENQVPRGVGVVDDLDYMAPADAGGAVDRLYRNEGASRFLTTGKPAIATETWARGELSNKRDHGLTLWMEPGLDPAMEGAWYASTETGTRKGQDVSLNFQSPPEGAAPGIAGSQAHYSYDVYLGTELQAKAKAFKKLDDLESLAAGTFYARFEGQPEEGKRALFEQRLTESVEELAPPEAPVTGGGAMVDEEPVVESRPTAPAPAPVPQPEVQTAANPVSTFSLNVADVSYQLAAAALQQGQMPDPASIRSEEFINAFEYHDADPVPGRRVGVSWDRTRYPFAHNRDLLRLAVKTAAQGREGNRPLNLVLCLDNSGSMERADRVAILSEAIRVLAAQLESQDRVSVVSFARTARLWVSGLSGSEAAELPERLGELNPEGGTNLEAALQLAYEVARSHYVNGGINRVVVLTDGAANLGEVDPESLRQFVIGQRKQGIALDCFGVGWEGYNDDLLEVLSRNADGRYGFINTPEEAADGFAGQLAGALRVAAADVKVQVEFNPRRVTAYRQIGYAKHQLTKEQFRDNTVDAAEIGAAEAGNALYVIETDPSGVGPVGVVRVRFRVPETGEYEEDEWMIPYEGAAVSLSAAAPAMRLAATASAFSEWLADSPYAAEVESSRLLALLRGVPEVYALDPRPQQLEWIIRQAGSISGK